MPHRERASILSELQPPFTVARPRVQTAPFVWCSPHSGRTYPAAFLASVRLSAHALRKSEDCYVDDLVRSVSTLGAPLLAAHFPRAYLDVNREPYELDPELFLEVLPDYANSRSARVVGGLGTIARIVADGEDIYAAPLSLAAALARIDLLYKPFHAALTELLDATYNQFGYSILIDCHSMPSQLLTPSAPSRPDFVLGDRFGAACHPHLTALVRDTLTQLGYDVLLNRPYAGGYITEHYGRPGRGVHALQIEINRGLYLDEATLQKKPGYDRLERDMATLAGRLFREIPGRFSRRAAAE
jgi:N-formylglutamate amidohydrolase